MALEIIKKNRIYQGDCLLLFKQIISESIDCIWTDPPFNINYSYEDYVDNLDFRDYLNWCEKWLSECYRTLKQDGSIYVKMWSQYLVEFASLLSKVGFIFKNIIIWKRKSSANYPNKYLGGYEVIYFYTKSDIAKFNPEGFLRNTQFLQRWDKTKEYKGRLNDLWDDIRSVSAGSLRHPEGMYIEGTGKKEHPAQHPIELVERAICCSSNEGDLILDPFIGSGTTAVACLKTKRDYIGFELSQKYVDLSLVRIKNFKKTTIPQIKITNFF